MALRVVILVWALLELACCSTQAEARLIRDEKAATEKAADVVVYGGSPAGVAAALGAADAGAKSVALLCQESELGGMATIGGIGLRDHHTPQLLTGTMAEWTTLNAQFYNVEDPVYQPDHFVGVKSLWTVIQRRPAVSVYLNVSLVEKPDSVVKTGTHIVSIDTAISSPAHAQPSYVTWTSSVFIDASYTGDLMRAAGARWTYGRESKSQYNESLAGVTDKSAGNFEVSVDTTWSNGSLLKWVDPSSELKPVGESDDRVMGYSYRLCITNNKANSVPFPVPQSYDPQDWELLRRYYDAMAAASKTVSAPFGALGYSGYPPKDKFDMCDAGTVTSITTDAANLARGYPNGTSATRQLIAAEHKKYLQGLIHFLLTDPSVPKNVYDSVAPYGLCKDEWLDNANWPPLLYVREAGRLVGDEVYTQNDRIPSSKLRRPDSIAVADWNIDIHIMSRTAHAATSSNGVGQVFAQDEGQTPFSGEYATFQFDLPYYTLLPRREDVTNLLVPNCPSVSHVVFAAVREEPTLWQLGRASGVAAALSVLSPGTKVAVQDLNVTYIQAELKSQGAVIHWPVKALLNSRGSPISPPGVGPPVSPPGVAPPVSPPRWGGNNQTLVWEAQVNMTDKADSPMHPNWTFDYYYDWTRNASRYDHHQGQYDEVCKGLKYQEDGQPCTVLNALDGKLYLLVPTHQYCCLCGKVFTIRSDWLQDGGTTYVGEFKINGRDVYGWLKYGASDNYYFATTDSTREPVRYMEHKNGDLKQWDFVKWKPTHSDDLTAMLSPPKNCTEPCETEVCKILKAV